MLQGRTTRTVVGLVVVALRGKLGRSCMCMVRMAIGFVSYVHRQDTHRFIRRRNAVLGVQS